MKKGIVCICIMVLGLSVKLFAQVPPIVWQKSIGGTSTEIGKAIDGTTDGGYILCGSTSSLNGDVPATRGGVDVFVIKLSKDGAVIWKKVIGSSANEYANFIKGTSDGGAMLVANTNATVANGDLTNAIHGVSGSDLWIVKFNVDGDIQWQKTIGGSRDESSGLSGGVDEKPDGGFVIGAYTMSEDGDLSNENLKGGIDAWALNLDANGNILWSKKYGGTRQDVFRTVTVNNEGNFVFTGRTNSNDYDLARVKTTINYNSWIVILNRDGNIISQKVFGATTGIQEGYRTILTADGGYILAGVSAFGNDGTLMEVATEVKGDYDAWVIKLDADLNIEWQHLYGGSKTDYIMSVAQTIDKGYVFAGYVQGYASNVTDGDVNGFNGGSDDMWLFKTDSVGKLLWQRPIGGTGRDLGPLGNEFSYTGLLDKSGNMFVIGTTNSNDGDISDIKGGQDAWVAKFSPCENLLSKPIVSLNGNVFSTIGSYKTYQWILNENTISNATSSNYTATTTGLYKVAISNEYNCKDTSDAVQYFAAPHIFVPNVFTPNGDGKNDVLKVFGNQIASIDFQIFNQWGQRIFATKDAGQGWDGRSGGTVQPIGVYMYTLKVNLLDGSVINKKGSISLLR